MPAAPDLGKDHVGLLSVLYEIEHDMAAFRPGDAQGNKQTGGTARHLSHRLRVPACLPSPFEAMHLWIQFMQIQLDPAAPILAIQPLGETWLDLAVGEPTAADLFSIRASRKKVTFTTDIPYALSDDFVQRAKRFMAEHGLRQREVFDLPLHLDSLLRPLILCVTFRTRKPLLPARVVQRGAIKGRPVNCLRTPLVSRRH